MRASNLNCQDAQKLLHGYVDGELDLLQSMEIDQHVQECTACAQAYTDLQAVRTAVKNRAPYFQAPSSLQKRIQSSPRWPNKAGFALQSLPLRRLAIAASLVFVLFTAWGLLRLLSDRSADGVSTPELVVASYVRSEMLPTHRLDVESSNQHTVKPWFAGKVDFAPSVPDLTDQGFNLVGGRLDYLDNRKVATLVYQRRQHIIDLFIWAATQDGEAAAKMESRHGYHLIHWTQSGMTYWAVSDLNALELQQFVRHVQEKTR
jgi:anti-sigma factor RsiW